MPIDNEHYAVYKVEGNPQLQRYISFEKFVSLISRQTLFFTRVDKLEDPFEGTSPKIVRLGLRHFYEQRNREGFFTVPMTDEVIEKNIKQHEEHTEKMRALYVINCWHKRESENALMWKAYSTTNSGIMIKSCYERVVNSLKDAEEKIQSSFVKYKDFENDRRMDFGNGLHPIINKTNFYSDETEIRFVHQVPNERWVHNWADEESQDGIYIKVNVDEMIEEIRVAPFAPARYIDIIKAVCEKFGVSKPISRSALAK
jgi:hypothetical protein